MRGSAVFLAVVLVGAGLMAAPVLAQGRGRGGGAAAQAVLPPGDAAAGQALVASSQCFDCHRVGETGSRVGPDLTMVGLVRTPEYLARALVEPDKDVLPEHRAVRVVTQDGATVNGRILNQDAFSIQLITDKEDLKSYRRADLREATILTSGLMPSYQGRLTQQQVNDVVNYLASLKGAQQ